MKLQGALRPLLAQAEGLEWAALPTIPQATAASAGAAGSEDALAGAGGGGEAATGTAGESKEGDGRDSVVVSFRLRPGSYALEAMRELMKQQE